MQPTRSLGLIALAALLAAAGCGPTTGNNNGNDGGTMTLPDGSVVPSDGGNTSQLGAGTCASPIDLDRVAPMGDTLVFEGNTSGMGDQLHPYGGCVERDAEEMIFRWHVPAGVQAVRISTAGSAFDTALYVRENCSQAMGGMDMACNNDSYDSAPQSTLYLTQLIEGQVIFIVVDGNASMGAMGAANGAVRLTIERVAFGGMGAPCRPEMEGSTAPRCDGMLACSEGGASDGTALCVPTVAAGATCDQRGYENTCSGMARCVTDPSPADGAMNDPVCAMPGTRAGAACRMTEPRCDAPWACGMGDTPVCVRQIAAGQSCDPMGTSNVCQQGHTCRALSMGGPTICYQGGAGG